jgi:hypothetical protein
MFERKFKVRLIKTGGINDTYHVQISNSRFFNQWIYIYEVWGGTLLKYYAKYDSALEFAKQFKSIDDVKAYYKTLPGYAMDKSIIQVYPPKD